VKRAKGILHNVWFNNYIQVKCLHRPCLERLVIVSDIRAFKRYLIVDYEGYDLVRAHCVGMCGIYIARGNTDLYAFSKASLSAFVPFGIRLVDSDFERFRREHGAAEPYVEA
jgi:hypothetical protein